MKRIFKYLIIVVALLPLLWACHNPLHFAEGKMHRVTIYLKNSQPGAPIATRAIGVTAEEETRINSVQLYIFDSNETFVQKITGSGSDYEVIIPEDAAHFAVSSTLPNCRWLLHRQKNYLCAKATSGTTAEDHFR